MTETRFVTLESRVERLEQDVHEIKDGIKQLLGRPQASSYRDVSAAAVGTLTIVALVFAFAEWRLMEGLRPVAAAVERLQQRAEANSDAVFALRLEAVRTEERMRMQLQRGSWAAKTVPH